MDLMNDEEFAPECIRALGEIGNPEAEQMLITPDTGRERNQDP